MIPPDAHNTTILVLRRTFSASRQRVFRAWTEPAALQSWLRPRGMSITVRSFDCRVGGSFSFELENGNIIVGTYLRIDSPEKLVFTWTGEAIQNRETIVTLDFLDHGSQTEVVLTHERLDTPHMRALFSDGWQTLLAALASALSNQFDS